MDEENVRLVHIILSSIDAAGTIGVLAAFVVAFLRGHIVSRSLLDLVCKQAAQTAVSEVREAERRVAIAADDDAAGD